MKYKYVIFDFNGTILNDVDLCLNLLNEMLILKNEKPVSKETYKNIFTFPIIEYYKKAGFKFDKYSFDELAKYFIVRYQPASLKCELYEGLIELFDFLISKNVKLILLSASKKTNLLEQVRHFGIEKYFDDILGLDNINATSKESLARNLASSLKSSRNEILFIGDTLHDFEIASNLGCDCYNVDFGHQSREILLSRNDKIISSYKELKEIFND